MKQTLKYVVAKQLRCVFYGVFKGCAEHWCSSSPGEMEFETERFHSLLANAVQGE